MAILRAVCILTIFFLLTLPGMLVQLVVSKVWPHWSLTLPHWYHRLLCRLLGVHIHLDGELVSGGPVLLIANHVSWLDIPVISAVAPVSFIAKKDVVRWPFVSWLAWLQRTIFIDRESRGAVLQATRDILARLNAGDNIVLFAEGTSSDGNRVLPFHSSLFAAARPTGNSTGGHEKQIYAQTLAFAYTHLHGLPLGRLKRPLVAWYGDMALASHVWTLLMRGPVDVHMRIGPPVRLDRFADRKDLANFSEEQVRRSVVELLLAREAGADMRVG